MDGDSLAKLGSQPAAQDQDQTQTHTETESAGGSNIAKLLQTLKDANALIDPSPEIKTEPEDSIMDAGDEADYESSDLGGSSDSDSDPDSDSDMEDEDAGARQKDLLRMIAEGGDDADDPMAGTDSIIATRNEIINPVVPSVSITQLPEAAPLVELGAIHSVVDNSVIIEAHISGETHVLDSESIVAFGDRKVLGPVFDVFGPVARPLYSVRFNSAGEIDLQACTVGRPVFFSAPWSKMLATDRLRVKGTDASNEYDEEVGSDHMEFSDDEAEQEHRRQKKKRMQEARQKGHQAMQAPAGAETLPGSHHQQHQQQPPPPPPSQAGRKLQSYQDLYDPDLGF